MPSVKANGITIEYEEFGRPDARPMLLIMGLGAQMILWDEEFCELLADCHFRVIRFDNRDVGKSTWFDHLGVPDVLPAVTSAMMGAPVTAPYTLTDMAADAVGLLDALGIERAHVVGHSMGTAVAQLLALERPERVRRLVLIAGFASMVDGPMLRDFLLGDRAEGAWKDAFVEKGHRFPEDVYELTPLDADPGAEKWMIENWVTDPTADPEYLAAIARETARVPLGTWLGAARAFLSFDNREHLSELAVPTLVLWPTQDNIVPRSPYQTELLASLDRAAASCRTSYVFKQYGSRPLPASGLQEDDFGHNLQWGPSREVALDLASWLRAGEQPTKDHYFADPENVRRVVTKKGEAILIEARPKNCPATQK
jgi:pimeloyl-ACP methyl ester carboxylesterase